MIIPFYKSVCVSCGRTYFSRISSWCCDECRGREFRKNNKSKKGGAV